MKQNILEIVSETLLASDKYKAEDGTLLKAKVYSDVMTANPELISLLVNNQQIRDLFFIDVAGALVFDKQEFAWLIDSKEFLPDSYTHFSNKIGLSVNDRFLTLQNDVVLDFPYKDCILEGGQEKENQKRDEIFYHELISHDEITTMLEAKVLSNSKRYTISSVEEASTISNEDNLLIKGNNLIALAALLHRYEGKIKSIYIDPPYNSGGDENIFSYNNTFNHSTWLTFIKNRLDLAKRLLKDDGFITIAIDHNELFYLGVLCDEIFGRENYISIITVQHNPKGRNQAKFISSNSEFLLIYAKNKELANFETVAISDDVKSSFTEKDDIGLFRWENYIRARTVWSRSERPDNWYPIYVSQDLEVISSTKFNNSIELYPTTSSGEFSWKNVKDTFDQLNKEKGFFRASRKEGKIFLEHKYRENEVLKNVWIDKKYQSEFNGTNLLKDLVGNNNFSYPKSVYAVVDIIKITSGNNDIVLDFFAGSGTTAHAVLLANMEQGFTRKFILCEQLDEHLSIISKRLENLLKGIQNDSGNKYLVKDSFDGYLSFELKEDGIQLLSEINNATETSIFQMKDKVFNDDRLRPQISKMELISINKDFNTLPLLEKKKVLALLVNKNRLYVNFSDINDTSVNISANERLFSEAFYSGISND